MTEGKRRTGLVLLTMAAAGALAVTRPGPVDGAAGERGAVAKGRTIDEQFAAVARRTPSFGGMYMDEERNVLYVYSWDQSAGAAAVARDAIAAVFGDQPPGARVQILTARYGFPELKAWHDRMSPGVLDVRGVVMTDIDDRSNRLTVGVESLKTKGAIEDRLFELGIPAEAVNIVETPAVALENSLRDRHRPLVGGLQIAFQSGGSTF